MEKDNGVLNLLEELREELENAVTIPVLKKVVVDRDVVLEIIEDITNAFPDELKQAKWVKEETSHVLENAKMQATQIIQNAESEQTQMLDNHRVVKEAYLKKEEIINNANETSRQILNGTKEYADELLGSVQRILEQNLQVIKEDREELRK